MSPAEIEVYARLERCGIEYELVRHAAVFTIQECALPMRLLGALMPRNMLLCPRNKSAYYLLLAHPSAIFKTSLISAQAASSRLSFAAPETLNELMHTHSGALSPFGLMYATARNVKLLIDSALLEEEFLLFHPLVNTASIKLKTRDFTEKFLISCGHGYKTIEMEHYNAT